MIRRTFGFVVLVLFTGCATKNPNAALVLASTGTAHGPVDQDYAIRPGDVVQVDVFEEPDLTTRQRVSQNGIISMPLIGPIPIVGKTTATGAAAIAKLLDAKYVVKPYITITVLSYAPRRITMLGQIRSPGAVSIPDEERMSLPQAIATAGGPTDIGNLKNVVITRKVNGQVEIFKINALAPNASEIFVQEGDIITIKETIF